MNEMIKTPEFLFESSWEVCNKVGGIYSVVSSKALQAVEQFGEDYFLLGPALAENPEFEETDENVWDSLRMAFATKDLKCRRPLDPHRRLTGVSSRRSRQLHSSHGRRSPSSRFPPRELLRALPPGPWISLVDPRRRTQLRKMRMRPSSANDGTKW